MPGHTGLEVAASRGAARWWEDTAMRMKHQWWSGLAAAVLSGLVGVTAVAVVGDETPRPMREGPGRVSHDERSAAAMRPHSVLLGVLVLGWLVACGLAAEVPSRPQAQQIIASVAPRVERALQARGLRYGAPIFVRLFKASRELEVWVQKRTTFHLFRIYPICAVSGDLGPKQEEGDLQAPEGFYVVPPERINPGSHYYLAFDLGYPNTYDQAYGRTGSALMIHGNCVSAGCYAMTDADMADLYALADAALRQGQPFFEVHAFPFRMTSKRLRRFRHAIWYPFWVNLKEGYDHFARLRRPPQVVVRGQRYLVTAPPRGHAALAGSSRPSRRHAGHEDDPKEPYPRTPEHQ